VLKNPQALRRRESLPTEFRQEGIPDALARCVTSFLLNTPLAHSQFYYNLDGKSESRHIYGGISTTFAGKDKTKKLKNEPKSHNILTYK
jgi:hypothetical protein